MIKISQQGFTIVSAQIGQAEDMSDRQYLAIQQFNGNRLFAEGNATGSAQIAAIIPAIGKTYYHANANCSQNSIITNAGGAAVATLENDGTVRGSWETDNRVGSSNWRLANSDAIADMAMGDSLDGDGVFEYSLEGNSNSNVNIRGALDGWILDDAVSP